MKPSLDMEIRRAIGRLVEAAPSPRPVELLDVIGPLQARAHRGMTVAIAATIGAMVVAGTVALTGSTGDVRMQATVTNASDSSPDSLAYPYVAAVVTSDSSTATDRVTIDKGSSVGIRVGMPVLNREGLVGRITSVEPMQSEVLLVSSEDYAVSARAGSVSGTLEGKGAGLRLYMRVLTDTRSPVVGDVVETAGGSASLAPMGIPIGVVVSVGHATGSSMLTAEVEWISAGSLSGTVTVLLYDPSDAAAATPAG